MSQSCMKYSIQYVLYGCNLYGVWVVNVIGSLYVLNFEAMKPEMELEKKSGKNGALVTGPSRVDNFGLALCVDS